MFRRFISVFSHEQFTCFRHNLSVLSISSANVNRIAPSDLTCRLDFKARHNFGTNTTLFDKIFVEKENAFSHSVMAKMGNYSLIRTNFPCVELISEDEYLNILNNDWSTANPQELLICFKKLSEYAKQNNINIAEDIFDKFIDIFTDNIQHLSDEQLEEIFWYLKMWPETNSPKTRNFIEVWAALDDVLWSRMHDWSVDKSLLFGDYACYLRLGRKMDYTYKLIIKALRKYKYIEPRQFVQIMYYIGIRRSMTIKISVMKETFERVFDNLTSDEIAIVCIGFFKCQTTIRHLLLHKIIDRCIQDVHSLHDISLTSFLKIIGYSYTERYREGVNELLNALNSRIDALSFLSCTHVAILSQSSNVYNMDVFSKISEKFIENPGQARLKDLERLALAFGSVDIPASHLVREAILNELRKPERHKEILEHGRTFNSCLLFLLSTNTLDASLISMALDENFLKNSYGSHFYSYGREVLALDNSIEIEYKNYTGNRLNEKCKKLLAKKYTMYVPPIWSGYVTKNYMTQIYVDIALLLKKIRGEEYVSCTHVLPHFVRADIVIGNDQTGNPLPAASVFERNYKVQPKPSEGTWFVLILADVKGTVDNVFISNHFKMKIRQLNVLGYKPVLILTKEWFSLADESEKIDFLNKKITEELCSTFQESWLREFTNDKTSSNSFQTVQVS